MKKFTRVFCLILALCLMMTAAPAARADGLTVTELMPAEEFEDISGGGSPTLNFGEGVAWVRSYNGYTLIDINGNVVIQCGVYGNGLDEVLDFSEGVGWAVSCEKHVWVLLDTAGNELFALEKNAKPISGFHDGLSKIWFIETAKYSYVDKTGNFIFEPERDYTYSGFHDGLALYYDSANAYYGYMDKTGKLVIPTQYNAAQDFENGFGLVQIGYNWTVIDTAGKEIIPLGWSVYTPYGHLITSPQAVQVINNESHDYGFVNKAGEVVSSGYLNVSPFSDGMAKVEINTGIELRAGYVDESGKLVIPCTLPIGAQPFVDGYALVETGNYTYNIIDKSGKVTGSYSGEANRATLSSVGAGRFAVYDSSSGRTRVGLIDYTGKELVPCKYKAIGTQEAGTFFGGVISVLDFNEKYGIMDTSGNEIVPCILSGFKRTSEPDICEVRDYKGEWTGWSLIKISGVSNPPEPEVPAAESKFTDVKPSDYFADPVKWAVEKGITTGATDTTFAPYDTCTRAQIITFLWRAAGSPEPFGATPFTDVKADAYYAKATAWAAEKGIAQGDAFAPNDPCTRQTAVEFMWKYAGSPAAAKAGFSDVSSPAVDWAVEKGVTNGTSTTENTFSPADTCTRGQIVTFLYRAFAK